jgi:hypothetical protein
LEERVSPATLTVNSSRDTASSSDAYLSLREAIVIFNSPTLPSGLSSQILAQISGTLHMGRTDSIVFNHSQVTTPITLGGTQLELSLPASTAAVTIDGGSGITVDGNSASRVFQVDSGVQATLDHFTITHGMADAGGGISNAGTLTVSNSTLSSNSTTINDSRGGGIFNNGMLTVNNSTLSSNDASSGGGVAGGGGIYNNGGTVTVSNSTLTANGGSDGGGIFNYSGTVTVSGSTFSSNDAYAGGGIYNAGTMTVRESTLESNAIPYPGFSGGGIYNSGTLTVTNSTLSSNSATNPDTRVSTSGGGLYNLSGPVTVTNSTLSSNFAMLGGGIFLFGGTLRLQNSIVAGNSDSSSNSGPDINGVVDSASSSNLVGVTDTRLSGISNGSNGNLLGSAGFPIDPHLGPLANNGGPTRTRALLAGSPARGAGSLTYATATDQRGLPRVVSGQIDQGAYQAQTAVTAPQVVASDPAGVIDPPVNHVRLTFNHPMDLSTMTTAQFSLTGPGGSIAVTGVSVVASTNNQQFDVSFASQSQPGDYALVVGAAVRDVYGTTQGTSFTTRFIVFGLTGCVLTVNSSADTANPSDPYLSLREAIAIVNSPTLPSGLSAQILAQISSILHAHGSDAIVFDHSLVTTPITLTDTHLELSLPGSTRVTIDGGSGVTVDGNNASRVFQVDSGVQANLDRLTITHAGGVGDGGGINNGGRLTVSNSTLDANVANNGNGGGISNSGTLTVSNSTVTANTAGAVNSSNSGGGISNSGTLTVTNSAITANSVRGFGAAGGISNSSGGSVTVSNSTINSNTAGNGGGGGIFNSSGSTITVSNSTINSNGLLPLGVGPTSVGGGIYNGGTLTVTNSTLSSNAPRGFGASGGGIYTTGTLMVSNSTFASNDAEATRLVSGGGGGIFNTATGTVVVSNSTFSANTGNQGGGINNYGTLTVSNSTFSANSASGGGGPSGFGAGGGIYNGGTLIVTNSTLTANSASGGLATTSPGGGGLRNDGPTFRLQNTIVAGNTSSSTANSGPDINGAVDSTSSYNLVGIQDSSLTGISNGTNHNQIGTTASPLDPQLAPLDYYGGPTRTQALLPTSPACHAGDPGTTLTTDQRGLPRPLSSQDDIGAFQSQANPFLVTTLLDPGHTLALLSLREAVNLANVLPGSNTVSFDPGLASGTVTLTSGELLLSNSIAIAGPTAGPVTLSADNASRVFEITAGSTASLTSLNIANGQVSSTSLAQGGGILNAGTLSLTDCTVRNNQATLTLSGTGSEDVYAQGGGISTSGPLTLLRCTLAGNSATLAVGNLDYGNANGGGLYDSGGVVSLTNCTVSGNQASATFSGGAGLAFAYGGGLTCDNGTLSLTGCTVNGNTVTGGNADGEGGGVHSYLSTVSLSNCTVSNNTAAATAGSALGGGVSGLGSNQTVSDCLITNNQASLVLSGTGSEDVYSKGGGLYDSMGMLTLLRCTVAGNSATLTAGNLDYGNANGGGLYDSGGTVTLTNSTVSGNSTTGTFSGGAGLVYAYGGGLTSDIGTLSLTGCTVSGNTVTGGNADGEGGGVHSYTATVSLSNCTIANNTANSSAGVGLGGGVSDLDSNLTLTSCTITGNAANSTASTGSGGGFYHSGVGTAQVLNTIVAGNSSLTDSPDANGSFASLGSNLIGIADGSSGWGGSDLTGTASSPLDPMLGTLGSDGGPTATMPLLAGSPALDAGNPGQLGSADQRGVVRSGGVNIGAFQASATSLVVSAPSTVTAGVAFDVTVSAFDPFNQPAVGYTGTVTFSSGDPAGATLPAAYTFTLIDAGVHTFAGLSTLYTLGTWDVTANDSANGLVGSVNVNVSGGNAPTGGSSPSGGRQAGLPVGPTDLEVASALLRRHAQHNPNGKPLDRLV